MATIRTGTTLVAAGLLMAAPEAAWAVRIDYELDVGIEHNDNVTLAATDPIDVNIGRAGVGFGIYQDSSALQASVLGRVEYRTYQDDVYDDSVDGTLSGRLNWVILPERLAFTVQDDLSLQSVNTLAADVPGNRQQVNVFSAGPTLFFNVNPTLDGVVELRYLTSDAEITDEFNSDRINLALRAIKEIDPTSRVSANVQVQQVDFDDDIVARDYDRYDVYARYARALARFDLGVDVGYSRLDYNSGQADRSDPLLRADLSWRPNARHRITLSAYSQFSDTASDAMAGTTPVEDAIPGSISTGDSVVNASPYEERRLLVDYTLVTPRTTVTIAPYVQQLRYVESDQFDQDGDGLRFDVSWQVRPRLRLGAYAAIDRTDYVNLNREDQTRRYGVTLTRQWTQTLSSRLEYARYERRSTAFGEDADQNILYLSLIYSNR